MLAEKDPRDKKLALSQQHALTAQKAHSNAHCVRKSITSTQREVILPLLSILSVVVGGPELGPRNKELLQQGQLKFMEVCKGLERL